MNFTDENRFYMIARYSDKIYREYDLNKIKDYSNKIILLCRMTNEWLELNQDNFKDYKES